MLLYYLCIILSVCTGMSTPIQYRSLRYMYVCVHVGVHDLPACTASILELCHAIVLRPHKRGPVGNGNGFDSICHIERVPVQGRWRRLINSDCATRGCLYFAKISRPVRRRVRACVYVSECRL